VEARRAVRNCFWLRNPNIAAKHIIDYDDNGRKGDRRARSSASAA
jgi:hypothetical protein